MGSPYLAFLRRKAIASDRGRGLFPLHKEISSSSVFICVHLWFQLLFPDSVLIARPSALSRHEIAVPLSRSPHLGAPPASGGPGVGHGGVLHYRVPGRATGRTRA